MTILRAAAIFSRPSGLAKDRVVNTFHFEGQSDAGAWAAIATAVRQFYELTNVANGLDVDKLMSSSLKTLDILVYEIPGTLQANGRETPAGPPVHTNLGVANDFGNPLRHAKRSEIDLPSEVAVCCSYQGTPAPGVEQSRRRGRLFLGPLNQGASSTGPNGPRPSAEVRDALGAAYSRLTASVDAEVEAVVYSRPFPGRGPVERIDKPDLPALPARPAVTVGIDQIWVDDEFDTQRRRGLVRTGRTFVAAAG